MNYVGVDLHKKYSVLCAVDERGVRLREARIEGNTAEGFAQFFQSLEGPSKAVLEACWNWGLTHDLLEEIESVEEVATVSSASGGTYKLGYDALGRCVKRTTNDAAPLYFAYDGVRAIIAYCVDAGTVYGNNIYATTFYGLGVDEIIARGNNGVGEFPLQNRLGSTTAITGGTGEVIEQYRYDVFGTPEFRGPPVTGNPRGALLTTGTMVNNQFLFAGREWVPNFGFYENRARAYHPKLGRFMSEDPTGFAAGDTNLFRYCGGDPVNATDPSGLNTYIGFRSIGSPHAYPSWSNNTLIGHEFLFTTSGNQLAGTFGWGENANPFRGTWEANTYNDTVAATTLIRNGGAYLVSDSSLDPFIPLAYEVVSRETPHVNGLINCGISNTCQGEARHLVDVATYLQAQFLISRLLGYDSNGSPVYYAPAVSGFDSSGNPIYDTSVSGSSSSSGGAAPGSSAFFGLGLFYIQNAGGLEGAGREYWLEHEYSH